MENLFKINIDKLRLCFVGPNSLAVKLENRNELNLKDFKLTKTAQTHKGCQFKVEIIQRDKVLNIKKLDGLGILRVGGPVDNCPFSKPQNYFWFDYYNKKLYETPAAQGAQTKLQALTSALGITFHKLTYLEIAADSATNYLPSIASALSNPGLKVFTLGKAPDRATQEYRGLNWEVWQSAKGITNTALRLKNKEKTMELYCYDKAREIGVSGKTYISEATGLGAKGHWRYELRLHGPALEPYYQALQTSPQALFPAGRLAPDLLPGLFQYFSQRLIRAKAYRGSTLSRKALQFWEFPADSAFTPLISIGGLNAHNPITTITLFDSSLITINL